MKDKFCFIYLIFYALPGLLFSLTSCSYRHSEPKIKIGFSQCVGSDKWRKNMLEGMKRELSFYPNVSFYYRDADNSSEKQISQINELLKEGIDLLIVSPNEAKPLTPIIENIINSGIPTIVIDRKTTSSLYTSYIGANNYEIGKRAGQYAANLLHGKGNIVEVMGLAGSSPAIERDKGFFNALHNYPGIKITAQVYGNWLKEKAMDALNALPDSIKNTADLVFAHNDFMALGSYEYFRSIGLADNIHIIGVDGLPNLGLDLIKDRILTATALYPTGGEEAIKTAMAILTHQTFQKDNILKTVIIDSSNVELMKLQADKINSQQADIEKQQTILDNQRKIYRSQSTILVIVLASLIVSIILGAITFFYLRENKKINKRLKSKNAEIVLQQQQLIEMSSKAQAAHEAKLNFFTNISHEFRTPLTLILAPLEDLLNNGKLNMAIRQNLFLVQKNVIRLLRLVNQLMDFRKIEVDKLKLRATENNLVEFISEIMDAFKGVAEKRNIDFRLITKENNIPLWFDTNMLDKVIFNLLSNAFKFTSDGGYINLFIIKCEKKGVVQIKIEDNGIGMSNEAVSHAFELFYQGENENIKGSGLGLALSRELINLHKGSISVQSEKWKGTSFEIQLPIGKEHLEEDEIIHPDTITNVLYNHEKIYTSDLEPDLVLQQETTGLAKDKEYSILIIEDNPELRKFLAGKLNSCYEVLEADNGKSALQQAFDTIPDLIICDVVIPGKDGIALTNIFKYDMRTSHIPIILLTAKTGTAEQIQGMKNRADCYITKPFNVQYLEETIRSLLINRSILKEHYTADLTSNLKTQTVNKLDRKFVNEFTSLIESNLANENLGVDDICKTIGISRVQLYRKVKALLGINVNDYILQTRLQKAKYLLQHEEYTIGEIAYKVGFSSPAYFSTVFKSKFGMTPKDFKEK